MEGAGSASGCDLLIFQKYAVNEQPVIEQPWISSTRCEIQVGTPSVGAVTSQSMDYGTETNLSSLFTPESDLVFGQYMATHSYRYGTCRSYYVVEPCAEVEHVVTERFRALQAPLVPAQTQNANVHLEAAPIRSASNDMIVLTEAKNAKEQARIESARAVFAAAKAVFAAEVSDDMMHEVEELRAALNTAYDAFTASYGVFHAKDNKRLLGTTILEYPVLLALEVNPRIEAGTAVADKAPVFSQRISQVRRSPVAGSCTLEEALTWSLAEKARVDLPLIATLAGVTPDEAATGLAGRIYRDLDASTETWVLADELLSGNVREKLALARRLATLHPAFGGHVPALEAVQPTPLTRAEIKVNLGATWLPVECITHFIGSLIPDFRSYNGTVEFHAVVNAWKITAPRQARGSYAATEAWATDRRNFFDIFDALIHQRELVIMDEFEDEDGKIVRRMNQPATAAANAVAERIKEAFQNWLWADEFRAQELERRYNEQFNCFVERRYNGDHLAIAGLNTTGLRTGDADPHQKDVMWRILAQQATYIAHPVGAGKTLTMLGGMSEALRRGMARKVLVCVPNSIVQQWAADVLRFFPGLRVLAMTAKDFEKRRRRQFLAHIATGQWDIVVVGTTTFTRLPLPLAVRKQFYVEEISSLRQYLYEVYNTDVRSDKEKKRDRALKRIESRAQTLEAKLKALDATITREDEQVLNLVELGFDMLVVDEFHLYKNLEFSTTKTRVAGLPSGGSDRAFDMWQKIQFFMRNGNKVVTASGTPIANTLCEAYVNMKYLQWNLMHELGISHFDAWAAQFAEPTLSFELRPDASGFRTVLRMSKFINLPELHQLTRQVMDVKLEAELKLPRPQIITGKPVPVVIDASEQLVDYIRDLGNRADAISNGQVDPEEDNMLKITSDGRLAALDMRLVGGTRDAGNKIDRLVENVLARYHESAPWAGTQIVFCDLATPKGKTA
jgi:N12 class adenine-specific DNA methylase